MVDLHAANHDSLGFLPRQAMLEYVERRQALIGRLNGQECSYVIMQPNSTTRPGIATIHQACVQYDARRREVATQLVKRCRLIARNARAAVLHLWCRSELDANMFWLDAGFEPVAVRPGGKSRGLPVIGWRQAIVAGVKIFCIGSTANRSECGPATMLQDEQQRQSIKELCRSGSMKQLSETLSSCLAR